MATVTDIYGNEFIGALRAVPDSWSAVNADENAFMHYKVGSGDVYAIVEPNPRGSGWVWRLHAWSATPVADNEFGTPCKTALQGVRAVERAAARHSVSHLL
ncbi:hypothetical protein [Streptomyces sp. bgisy159]|uniref:hypothetical protein n=1 Tax=Streptomyces sp. bgisy159 TaxID=3413795 RepID=UPI003F4A58CD